VKLKLPPVTVVFLFALVAGAAAIKKTRISDTDEVSE
jgi:hypothetical protein